MPAQAGTDTNEKQRGPSVGRVPYFVECRAAEQRFFEGAQGCEAASVASQPISHGRREHPHRHKPAAKSTSSPSRSKTNPPEATPEATTQPNTNTNCPSKYNSRQSQADARKIRSSATRDHQKSREPPSTAASPPSKRNAPAPLKPHRATASVAPSEPAHETPQTGKRATVRSPDTFPPD